MDATEAVQALINAMSLQEERDIVPYLAEVIRERSNYFVAEDDAELRELALKNTDLVEPE